MSAEFSSEFSSAWAYTHERESRRWCWNWPRSRISWAPPRAIADERLRSTAAATLAEERLALLDGRRGPCRGTRCPARGRRGPRRERREATRQERREHDLPRTTSVRLELRVEALKRRRERLQAELCKFQDQLARADVSGRIRELQEEKAQLQQRLADLQTYFALRDRAAGHRRQPCRGEAGLGKSSLKPAPPARARVILVLAQRSNRPKTRRIVPRELAVHRCGSAGPHELTPAARQGLASDPGQSAARPCRRPPAPLPHHRWPVDRHLDRSR